MPRSRKMVVPRRYDTTWLYIVGVMFITISLVGIWYLATKPHHRATPTVSHTEPSQEVMCGYDKLYYGNPLENGDIVVTWDGNTLMFVEMKMKEFFFRTESGQIIKRGAWDEAFFKTVKDVIRKGDPNWSSTSDKFYKP